MLASCNARRRAQPLPPPPARFRPRAYLFRCLDPALSMLLALHHAALSSPAAPLISFHDASDDGLAAGRSRAKAAARPALLHVPPSLPPALAAQVLLRAAAEAPSLDDEALRAALACTRRCSPLS